MNEENGEYRWKFFGYGNPDSTLWFVGIEEGGSLESNRIRKDHPNIPGTDFTYDPDLPTGSQPVWNRYRDLAAALGVGNAYFMTNLAPFAKPQESHGLGFIGKNEYQDLVIKRRVQELKSLIERFKPRAVLFHGKGAWQRYRVREAFDLQPESRRIQKYPERQLLFSPFLGARGCKPPEIAEIKAILDPWIRH